MSNTEASSFAHYAGAWLSYETSVPELSSVYDTVLDRLNEIVGKVDICRYFYHTQDINMAVHSDLLS
jgi:hypothetical protein